MRGREHQILADQRPGAEDPAAELHASDAFPARPRLGETPRDDARRPRPHERRRSGHAAHGVRVRPRDDGHGRAGGPDVPARSVGPGVRPGIGRPGLPARRVSIGIGSDGNGLGIGPWLGHDGSSSNDAKRDGSSLWIDPSDAERGGVGFGLGARGGSESAPRRDVGLTTGPGGGGLRIGPTPAAVPASQRRGASGHSPETPPRDGPMPAPGRRRRATESHDPVPRQVRRPTAPPRRGGPVPRRPVARRPAPPPRAPCPAPPGPRRGAKAPRGPARGGRVAIAWRLPDAFLLRSVPLWRHRGAPRPGSGRAPLQAGAATRASAGRPRPAGRPVEELDRVDDGHAGAPADLHHAADVARGDHVGPPGLQRADLARLQLLGDLGLHEVVGARRSAA